VPKVAFELRGDEALRQGIDALGSEEPRVKFMQDAAILVENKAKENVNGPALKVRSGRGRAAITHDNEDAPRSFAVGAPGEVGRYLGAHETGATILPVRSSVLTIPLDAALTASGVPRFSAREAASRFDHTFWRESRAGNLILFGRTGKKLTPLFVGVDRVVLPKRPWLRPAFDAALPEMEQLLIRRLEERLA
jgi:hypothetical protein